MLPLSRRHVPGPDAFNDAEFASFGPTLRHLQRVLFEEDFANIQAVNRGTKSRGFRGAVLNPVREAAGANFHGRA